MTKSKSVTPVVKSKLHNGLTISQRLPKLARGPLQRVKSQGLAFRETQLKSMSDHEIYHLINDWEIDQRRFKQDRTEFISLARLELMTRGLEGSKLSRVS